MKLTKNLLFQTRACFRCDGTRRQAVPRTVHKSQRPMAARSKRLRTRLQGTFKPTATKTPKLEPFPFPPLPASRQQQQQQQQPPSGQLRRRASAAGWRSWPSPPSWCSWDSTSCRTPTSATQPAATTVAVAPGSPSSPRATPRYCCRHVSPCLSGSRLSGAPCYLYSLYISRMHITRAGIILTGRIRSTRLEVSMSSPG